MKLKIIVFCGIFKSFFDKTALNLAVENGNKDIVELLLSCNKINPNIRNVQI